MRPQLRKADQVIANVARHQHGVVTRAQLLAFDLSPAEIKYRVGRGSLIRIHRGVYRVGHCAPSPDARYIAAVLACGDEAVLSGLAAAHLHRLLRGHAPRPQVTAPRERRVPGIKSWTRRLHARETTTVRGIPVTTVPRTLVDISPLLEIGDLARAFHEADVRHGTKPKQVEAVLARNPYVAGARKMRRVLYGEEPTTLSGLEREFLRLLREAGLPLPSTNRPAGTKRVDCRWPDHRLTVELDSYQFHRTRHAWEQDRRGEREARARRDAFRRYTHADVFEDRHATVAEVADLLRVTARSPGAAAGGAYLPVLG